MIAVSRPISSRMTRVSSIVALISVGRLVPIVVLVPIRSLRTLEIIVVNPLFIVTLSAIVVVFLEIRELSPFVPTTLARFVVGVGIVVGEVVALLVAVIHEGLRKSVFFLVVHVFEPFIRVSFVQMALGPVMMAFVSFVARSEPSLVEVLVFVAFV